MVSESKAILFPLFIQLFTTIAVLLWLVHNRMKVIKAKKIKLG